MSSAPRKQAPRLARPAARYWKGKAPKGVNVEESDSDEDEEVSQVEQDGDILVGGEQDIVAEDDEEDENEMPVHEERGKATKAMNITLKDVNISKDGKVIVAGREESGRTAMEEEEEDESEESEEDDKAHVVKQEESEESSEYESESEEDEKPKVQFRPVFVPKRNRVTVVEREKIAQDTEEALKKKEEELEERRKQSHDLVAESIRRELLEKEKEEEVPDIDDTDGLDPAAEFEAWRLRELARIKKEKEEEIRREEERAEIERRRALPEEQRLKEDLEKAQKSRDEKPKGQQKFLQKYWHKGAFHQDEEILKRHDFTEATESTVDVSVLPKVMQVKNFGKRSRTKYTHLVDQDTTLPRDGVGGLASKPGGKSTDVGGCFVCGGPHLKKDCPQNTGPLTRSVGTGANNAPSGSSRQWGTSSRNKDSWRDREDDEVRNRGWRDDRGDSRYKNSYRPGSRSPSRYDGARRRQSRSRSRSKSPPRRRDDREYRKGRRRSPERSRDDERIKRQRVVHSYLSELRHIAGLAGLTAAHLLSDSINRDVLFDVHLFEKARLHTQTSTVGMDSSSISLPNPGNKQEWRVDVPMRSFQGGYYKKVISLYKYLGVGFKETDFSYSFSNLFLSGKAGSIITNMIYNGDSGRGGVSMPSTKRDAHAKEANYLIRRVIWAWTRLLFGLWALQILYCYVRLLFLSIPFMRSSRIRTMTFRTWAKETVPTGRIARWTMLNTAWIDFTENVMLPLFSAVCTAPLESVFEHPMEEFLDYIWVTLGSHHYVASNGVQEIVSKLVANVPHVHLSSPISKIYIDTDNPSLATIECSSSSGTTSYSGFHHIIMATQANKAIPLLQSLSSSLPSKVFNTRRHAIDEQIACLQRFAYTPTIVVNHTDDSLLPVDVRDRRDLNLISAISEPTPTQPNNPDKTDNQLCLPPIYTMATHVLEPPKGFPAHLPTVFQTTNPIVEIRQSRVLSVARLERAVLTLDAKQALKGLQTEVRRPWWGMGQGKSQLGRLQGAGRLEDVEAVGVWLCGSFAYSGIPLLEGCVVSARNVVEEGIWKCEGYKGRIYW
ncbi:hypothetical protein K435DRAFT_829418 [Dendrothele bispora CBS 962.96]|uniref:Micro-fibrillar-associated protein 1 C-terminal domain-containing protein n=1 Tax=Dendrothele bispora (strain CBS 962.96) TaxID=1314807 RepID=A0A4S8LWK4_DENBC|nr:hypothetical protein K435DRAFT_829418 [Dendrothele bispora CBS 962.96]